MEAKIYNMQEYKKLKRKKLIKERGENTAHHPSRKVDRESSVGNVLNKIGDAVGFPEKTVWEENDISQDTDPTPPHGIERPVEMYDQNKDEQQFYDQDKD